MKKGSVIFSLTLLLFCMGVSKISAQEAKFKATFTLNFIRYIGWPEETKQGDFVIGVLKAKEIADFMTSQSAGKKFGFQDVVIKEFKNTDEITKCQVLFVSSYANFGRNADEILQKVGNNTLVITETEGATEKGAAINFVIRDSKLKFEIKKTNAAKAGLQVSSKLEGMASAINL
ncbi:MAG: YfiR family protein [Marinilabiliaceae bacterium]|nr:YfiR family protein [Marinilabiliaceae bacterium]